MARSLVLTLSQTALADIVYGLPDATLAAMESYRQSLLIVSTGLPVYADLMSMITGVLQASLINPALAAFPPASITTAAAAAQAAQTAYAAAVAAAGVGAVTTVRNLFPPKTSSLGAGHFDNNNITYDAFVTDPLGGSLAQTLTDCNSSLGSIQHWANWYTNLGAGTQTISTYFKQGTGIWAYITSQVDGTTYGCWFKLSDGTIHTNSFPSGSAAMTSLGSGWYRCSVTFPVVATAYYNGFGQANADNVYNYTSTGLTILQFGQQAEHGALTAYQAVPI